MSTFKKANVVMLPTNRKTNGTICKDITGKDRMINIKSNGLMEHEDYIGQHLDIISDDEIGLFDWVYNNKENIVEQINSKAQLIFVLEENKENQTFKKIIATTDTSLYIHQKETISLPERVFYLPQLSQQFIQKFVEEYNKGNVITEVMVEYGKEYVDEQDAYGYDKLKINPKNNTITIKKAKDNYSREEVDRLLDEQASKTTAEMLEKFKDYKSREEVIAFGKKVKKYCKDGWKEETLHRVFFEWDKWVEENL